MLFAVYYSSLQSRCYPNSLDAPEFKPSRNQRRALNRWTRYVLGEEYIREAATLYPRSKEEKAKRRNEFDLYGSVHECEYPCLKTPPEPAHRFGVTLEPSTFTEEKYQVFENYQRLVHHEPPSKISRRGFMRFLCDSPLKNTVIRTTNQQERNLGSYHQCYRLDGRLVAVGVLDLLPQCVSSVYFLYHEDVSEWDFGKLSALRETSLAIEGLYRYYYMGFYIHSCAKMRYKGDYHPQYILDPEAYTWDPLDNGFKHQLDALKYVSLSRERRLRIGTPPDTATDTSLEQEAPLPDNSDDGDTNELFSESMPGALTLPQVLSTIDLDETRIKVGPHFCTAKDLMGWIESDAKDQKSLKWFIAGFAAVLGKELVESVVVGF
ncbi:MAG: Arginyl-tRNA--protein transferase 1 [Geoglossum simile]|nr:MAG: Arginyl-tRNA--protein transferase 1 [Geoglossum simile]